MEDDAMLGTQGRDVGQGDRDADPELAREQQAAGNPGGHTAMPDFTSGPGYTGRIPRERDTPPEGDWSAGADVAPDSGPGAP
jgi:hypothetical protein